MKDFKKQFYILAGIACFGVAQMASGTAMGSAQIGQCAPGAPGGLSGVIVSGTTITWNPPTLAGTGGCFITGSPTDITSTQPEILSGETGAILNLVAGPPAAVDSFITFTGNTLDFILNGFGATTTTSTACDTTIGDSCIVAPGSPFELKNTSTGVAVTLTTLGTVLDGGVTSSWTGLFSTQVGLVGAVETAADIQTKILAGQAISSTYAAVINVEPPTTTPEPGTVSMFLLAGVGLIGLGRKKFAKR